MLIHGNFMKIKLYTSLAASLVLISGCTTYHTAAAKGNVKAIERLYNEGEDINEPDDMGISALICAVNFNQKESLLALLKSGADINAVDNEFGNTALHHAIEQGSLSFTRILLEKGADVSLQNKDGNTPLDLALKTHNQEMIDLIKSHSEMTVIVKKDESAKETKSIKKGETIPPKKSVVAVKEAVAVVDVIEKPSPKISDEEATATLKRLIAKHETIGVRNFLNIHPEAIALIGDSRQQLRYIGPSGWRIMDIAEGISRGVLKEKEIVDHIEASGLPYKNFTEDEIRIISHYGISIKIINAMISVTH